MTIKDFPMENAMMSDMVSLAVIEAMVSSLKNQWNR